MKLTIKQTCMLPCPVYGEFVVEHERVTDGADSGDDATVCLRHGADSGQDPLHVVRLVDQLETLVLDIRHAGAATLWGEILIVIKCSTVSYQ